jgi:hypothetical protein
MPGTKCPVGFRAPTNSQAQTPTGQPLAHPNAKGAWEISQAPFSYLPGFVFPRIKALGSSCIKEARLQRRLLLGKGVNKDNPPLAFRSPLPRGVFPWRRERAPCDHTTPALLRSLISPVLSPTTISGPLYSLLPSSRASVILTLTRSTPWEYSVNDC